MLVTWVYYSRSHYCTVLSWGNDIQGLYCAVPSLNDPCWLHFQFLDLLLTVSMSSGTLPYLSVSVRYTPSPLFQSAASSMLSPCRSDELRVLTGCKVKSETVFQRKALEAFWWERPRALVRRLPSLPLGCAQPCFGLPPGSRVYSKLVKMLAGEPSSAKVKWECFW